MQVSPAGQLSAVRVREAATNTAPHRSQLLRVTHLKRLIRRCGCLRRSRRISRFERFTRTRLVTCRQRLVATPTVPFAEPPLGSCAFHTSAPVSAFIANTQPRFVAAYTQPSARLGVAVKSPSPPASTVENVHAGDSSGASPVDSTFSLSWKREFAASCPNVRHSPPGDAALAQPGGAAAEASPA